MYWGCIFSSPRPRRNPLPLSLVSYEPLHHKYRPRTFADLIGQEAIAQTLENAIARERIAPAYLFAGPRGTGKTSSARILAKSLNCQAFEQPTQKPCGSCDVCGAIARGTALDVIEIDAASNTGVDNIRELIERAQFAPVRCRYKVYIIDEVHMLSTAAFNALLKTLEEPPNRVIFVLATTDPQRVLPTIISRCQRFDFRRIPLGAMVEHLGDIAAKEAIDITPDAVTLVAQVAQGGLRDAESLLDQLGLLPGRVTVERVWDLVGAVPERDLLALTEAVAADDPQAVLDRCRHLLDRGREPLVVLQNLAGFYRDLLIAQTAPNRSDLVAVTPPTWTRLCEFVQPLDRSWILHGQQHLRTSEAQVKNTTQPRLWLEVTLLGLLPSASRLQQGDSLPQTPSRQQSSPSVPVRTPPTAVPPPVPETPPPRPVREPPSQPSPAPNGSAPTPSPTVRPESPQSASATPSPTNGTGRAEAPPESLEQVWQQVLNQIKLFSTQQLLRQQCCLLEFKGQQATVGVNSKGLLKLAQGKLPDIEAAFAAVYQMQVKVMLQVKGGPSSSPANQPTAPSQRREPSPTPPPPSAPSTPNGARRESTSPSGKAIDPSPTTTAPSTVTPAPPPRQPSEALTPESPTPSTPTPDEDWDVDDVERALGNLKQFFDGEIIELTDYNQLDDGMPVVSQPTEPTRAAPPEPVNPGPPQPEAAPLDWQEDEDEEDIPF